MSEKSLFIFLRKKFKVSFKTKQFNCSNEINNDRHMEIAPFHSGASD